MPTALITGASRGLGRAFAAELAGAGSNLVVDARDGATLAAAARHLGSLDLLVNNAGALGPSPLPPLAELGSADLRALIEANVIAPLALTREALPLLIARAGTVVDLTSDAAVEAYPGWGGYGMTKAALEHQTWVLAVEHPQLTVHAFDPGDVRTDMHQAAFPGEDISDRADPEAVAPALRHLVEQRRPSGRYRAGDLLAPLEMGA